MCANKFYCIADPKNNTEIDLGEVGAQLLVLHGQDEVFLNEIGFLKFIFSFLEKI